MKGDDDNPILNHRYGPLYVVHFYNTCLHPDAQFRFFEPFSVLHNIGKNGTFLARYPSDYRRQDYKERFHIYHSPIPPSKDIFIYEPQFALKQTNGGALRLGNGYCPTPRTDPRRSLNPKNGAEVYHTTTCNKEDQKFIFGKFTKQCFFLVLLLRCIVNL